MTEKEAKNWIYNNKMEAVAIGKYISRWRSASKRALSDPRADYLASYFEAKAVEIYMDCGGTDDFRDVHLIGGLAFEMQKAGAV